MSIVNREPKQIMTAYSRINGSRIFGDPTEVVLSGLISAVTIIKNFKDYVPAYFMLNHITVTTPRSLTGGLVSGPNGGGNTQLASMGIQFLGNWLGYSVQAIGVGYSFYDVIKEFILDLSQGTR